MNEGIAKEGLFRLPDDVLKRVASLIHDPKALLNLALACKHLQRAVEGFTQAFIDGDATDEERNNLPRVDLQTMDAGGEWTSRRWGVIAKYKLILNHRDPLRFDQIIGVLRHAEDDKSKVVLASPPSFGVSEGHGFCASNRVMMSGSHRATFELSSSGRFVASIGITRPVDYCHTNADMVLKFPPAWHDESKTNSVEWHSIGTVFLCKGQQSEVLHRVTSIKFDGSNAVGLLLDMGNGTLTLYKNGNSVGTVVAGLAGEYVVWVAAIKSWGSSASIRICEWA